MAVVHPDAVFTEHPNPIAPRGAVRTVAESLAGFRAGRALLREQSIEMLEVLVNGDRAAVGPPGPASSGSTAARSPPAPN